MWRAIVLVLVFGLVAPSATQAADPVGCDGYTAFYDQVNPILQTANDQLAELGMDDDTWDPAVTSSDDWVVFADVMGAAVRELRVVTPPAWAEEWFDLLIQSLTIREQIGRTVATAGIFGIVPFMETMDDITVRLDEASKAAAARCPMASPMASPVASPVA